MEKILLRCCELWANKTDNIINSKYSKYDLTNEFQFGFFEYHEILDDEDLISSKLKNGRNITVACKEYDLIQNNEVIGKIDNTISLIEKMKDYNLVFHSRCYLTNGAKINNI